MGCIELLSRDVMYFEVQFERLIMPSLLNFYLQTRLGKFAYKFQLF